MSYTPTTWVEATTKLGPTNMNHLESGVQATAVVADAAIAKPSSPATNAGLVYNGSTWVAALLVNGNIDPSANIAYSKLTLAGSVVNNDIASGAAIAYSKLSLTGSVVASDMALAYTTYTPTWTSSGTAPAIGNAVVVARYVQLGKFVHAYGKITFGTTSTFGTGNYSFALPSTANANGDLVGTYFGVDTSASAIVSGSARLLSTSAFGGDFGATYLGTNTLLNQAGPWTWANTDVLGWNITYEAA